MANAVILYTGNVCSTPMIEYAREAKNVFVPFREQFDYYRISEQFPNEDTVCEEFAVLLRDLFERRNNPFFDDPGLIDFRGQRALPTKFEKANILFKWRCWNPSLKGVESIARVFQDHGAKPIIMLRRSLIEQVTKIHLSEKVYGGRHQQFAAAAMSAEEYQDYLEQQKRLRVRLTEDDIATLSATATKFIKRTRLLIDAQATFFGKKPLQVIVAEDIFKPMIDYDAYNRVLNRVFPPRSVFKRLTGLLSGPETLVEPGSESAVRKGGLELSHCENIEDVWANAELAELEAQYKDMISGHTKLS
ncbi:MULTISPECIES: hypothetical protein [unclassified Ruegeria]|uniref:hypothetical protein n=1 Tax=unclassified Ruegeria TaxID=2625375 RepID=UPI001488FE2F|nr:MULTISPECIES: hypothetical protein [unclassified Ruegeria]